VLLDVLAAGIRSAAPMRYRDFGRVPIPSATRFGLGLFILGPEDPNSTHRTSKGTWAVTAP